MNSPVEHESFDDPSLKRVCRQAWSGEKCPLELFAKLKASARQASLQTVQPVQSVRSIPMWYRGGFQVAAAAVVLMAVGTFTLPYVRTANASSASAISAILVDPKNKITQSIVAMHEKCCQSKRGHQIAGVPKEKVFATADALGKRLGQPVLATAIPERGWSFEGGAVCPVTDNNERKVPAAHFIYKSGNESVSLFTMPRSVSPCRVFCGPYEGTYIETKPDGRQVAHPIAGFVDSRGAYCLVGTGSPRLTQTRLAAMRDRLQSTVAAYHASQQDAPTFVRAEMLQPAR